MVNIYSSIILVLSFLTCTNSNSSIQELYIESKTGSVIIDEIKESIIDSAGLTILDRFNTPSGFKRVKIVKGSFAEYLRNLPLKPVGSPVKKYNGEIMPYVTDDVQEAVIDIDVGEKDLQQCADAIIRLRSEYYYHNNEYEKITSTLTNGFKMNFTDWTMGNRLKIKGNKTWWEKSAQVSAKYQDLRNYLDVVFMYAGTISMVKETKQVPLDGMQIGDIFIISNAHAVVVVDMCINPTSGEKMFMLAQSFMPARDIHILKNTNKKCISPWYSTGFYNVLETPQWQFNAEDLRRY